MLSKREENEYYDDKATCGRERAFLIAKRQACLPFSSIRLASHTYARSVGETKIARGLSIFLRTIQLISEE